jgi:large subunit ribosomal protein L22
MSKVTAQLNDYRQSPRKVRLVANSLRGKKVNDVLDTLPFLAKRSADPLAKLIRSAVANAKNLSIETDSLIIKEIRVDGGKILYRRQPASRGRAHPIRKRTSHISVVLEEQNKKDSKSKATKVKKDKKIDDKKTEV